MQAPARTLSSPYQGLVDTGSPAEASLSWRWLRGVLGYCVLFVLTGVVGSVPGHSVYHTIWLPAGVALGTLIVSGYGALPFLVLAHLAFLAFTEMGGHNVAWPSALVNMIQYTLGFWLLGRVRFDPAMKTIRDALLFLAFGAVIPCIACSPLGFVASRILHRSAEPFLSYAGIWSMRGVAGIVASAPLILAFAPGRRIARLPSHKLEFVLAATLTAAAALVIFFNPSILGHTGFPRSFLPYPILVWAALRLGLPGVTVCTLIVTVCAVQGTAAARGPFPSDHNLTSVLMVWVYVSISTFTAILLCVGREERRKLEEMLIEAGELERIRLGTELHDDICQQLAGAGFISGVLLDRPGLPPEARQHVDHICSEIKRSIQSMRNLARGLSPLGIGAQNLSAALTDLAALSESVYGIECRFTALGPLPALEPGVVTHLFRITQEAINNAVRHGRAAAIEITASAGFGCLILRICDDGVGLNEAAHGGTGLGFKTMDYRTDLLNGSFSVHNNPDARGVLVACSIPVATG